LRDARFARTREKRFFGTGADRSGYANADLKYLHYGWMTGPNGQTGIALDNSMVVNS
jgi:hypothetical protein